MSIFGCVEVAAERLVSINVASNKRQRGAIWLTADEKDLFDRVVKPTGQRGNRVAVALTKWLATFPRDERAAFVARWADADIDAVEETRDSGAWPPRAADEGRGGDKRNAG